MADTAEFTIGTEVTCGDEKCGKLTRVVLDPIAKAVTHVVVEPKALEDVSRLVPVGLVESATPERIRLNLTMAEFGALDPAEEVQFLPGTPLAGAFGPGQVVAWPYYSLELGPGDSGLVTPVSYDKVPLGEVEVRRGDRVHATDGEIGRVEGLVIDAGDRHVTHVLLQEGHLWDRKDVAIPVSAVDKVDEVGIKLKLTKEQLKGLPPVDIAQFAG
jgi:sporulation protein YlmC with PRC-barrel domain